MTRVCLTLCWVVVGVYAAFVVVTEPLGRPYGQPALVNHAAYGVDGPSGFDQAQGGGR